VQATLSRVFHCREMPVFKEICLVNGVTLMTSRSSIAA
jgi:hypothetical protein